MTMANPNSSRTGTTRWRNLRKQAITKAKQNGQTNCPICNVLLDYNQHGNPNSAEVDHIRPVAHGGQDHIDNLQIICRRDNQRLGGKAGNNKQRIQNGLKPKPLPNIKTGELKTKGNW